MIRSKDLVLFVVILFFLGLAIIGTSSSRYLTSDSPSSLQLVVTDLADEDYVAVADLKEVDRQSQIEHLRSKIAEGEVIESSPSVESVVSTNTVTSVGRMECPVPDTGISVARQWPLQDVSVALREGVRLVTHDIKNTEEMISASSTASSSLSQKTNVTRVALLQLSSSPQKAATPTCPTSEIIGVTTQGSLIFNSDATLYRNASSETIVGYALDGFPIYGQYSGQVDECGGYDSPSGYRYVVLPNANVFLNCFVGQPNNFQNI